MKKSITIIGKVVEYAYIIRDIDVDKVTVEKYSVECRNNIESAWGATPSGQITFSESNDQTLEVILKDKVSNITLSTKPTILEMVAPMGGKIIKDIKVERAKRGKKVYLSDVIFFKEAL